ncbi:MAG: quinoprotein relay system zinc metallohydrolase 2 [Gammaproteobacteria bacterium]
MSEIAEGIYVHQGKIVSTDHAQRDDSANIGFIIGDECIAVIDTGGSPAVGARLRQAIHKISDRKICYVINTHIHYDHLLGNAAFSDEDARFVGHENLAPSVEQNRAFFREEYADELATAGDNGIIGPDISVENTMKLDLGNRVLTLTAHGPAHTFTDLTVYDRKTQTLWLSDLLFTGHIPVLDGKLKGWLKQLDALEKIPAQKVIPGHGPIDQPWPRAGQEQRRYLETLRDEVRSMIAAGRFMEEVLDKAAHEEARSWQLYEHYHRRNVSKAFTELEWE